MEKVSYDQGHPLLFVSVGILIPCLLSVCSTHCLYFYGLTVLDVIVSTWVSSFDVLISKVVIVFLCLIVIPCFSLFSVELSVGMCTVIPC